jgi:hypothetical protein
MLVTSSTRFASTNESDVSMVSPVVALTASNLVVSLTVAEQQLGPSVHAQGQCHGHRPRMESTSVCEAIAAAAFCAQRIGGSPKRRSVPADGAPTGSR